MRTGGEGGQGHLSKELHDKPPHQEEALMRRL